MIYSILNLCPCIFKWYIKIQAGTVVFFIKSKLPFKPQWGVFAPFLCSLINLPERFCLKWDIYTMSSVLHAPSAMCAFKSKSFGFFGLFKFIHIFPCSSCHIWHRIVLGCPRLRGIIWSSWARTQLTTRSILGHVLN